MRRLTVTLGWGANDGASGEGDNLTQDHRGRVRRLGCRQAPAGVRAAVLHGGNGADVLTGGAGRDYLDGGGGPDVARRVRAGDRVLSCRIA